LRIVEASLDLKRRKVLERDGFDTAFGQQNDVEKITSFSKAQCRPKAVSPESFRGCRRIPRRKRGTWHEMLNFLGVSSTMTASK
jgi:hypothetical protein